MSNYVITGGAGFIGAALAAHLARAGHDVRVLDDLSGPLARTRAAGLSGLPRVSLIEGDVRDPEACRRVCEGADHVLHHAAAASDEFGVCADITVRGTVQMLEAARAAGTVQRFICASSGEVYGDSPAATKHESGQIEPLTARAAALLSAEHFCRSAFRRHGLQTVCLRYFDIYGPGQSVAGEDAPAIARLLNAFVGGGSVVIPGDGEQSRDYLHIEDAIEANLRAAAARRGVGGRVFNIGSGRSVSVNRLRETLERLTGRRIETEAAAPRAGEIKHLRADITAAAGLLQFTPRIGLDDGLARCLQDMTANAGHKE